MTTRKKFAATFIAALLAGTPAYAAPAQAEPQEIQMVSGGIGESGMDDIAAVQQQFSLKLVFAKDNGEFLADVGVQVRDSRGKTLVNINSQGPVLLINLLPGRYKVSASLGGETRTESIVIRNHSLMTHFIRLHGTES